MEDLFSGILPIIIIIVVINIIRSVAKKKKPAKNSDGEPQAPRPVMSDIQKAFRLMSEFDDKPEPEAKASEPLREGIASEGLRGRSEGIASEGLRGRTEGVVTNQGMRGRTEGIASSQGMQGLTEGIASSQGRGRNEMLSKMNAAYSSTLAATYGEDAPQGKDNIYAKAKIDKYTLSDQEDEKIFLENRKRRQLLDLKLFDNKDELVKAVIYSEILTRKAAR